MTAVTTPTVDLYCDVHKGLRHALFTVTGETGRTDVSDDGEVARLVAGVREVIALLLLHHDHEDATIQPLVERHAPDVAAGIAAQHDRVDAELRTLEVHAARLEQGVAGDRDPLRSDLYSALATFTSLYLDHMAAEEQQVMPALTAAMSQDELTQLLWAVRASISPPDMCVVLRYVLPGLDPNERTGLLRGIQAGAPAEIFESLRAVAEQVLRPAEYSTLAARLGLDTRPASART